MVVVGGGFTGLWTAWYLKQLEPEARVVAARVRAGSAATGRAAATAASATRCGARWRTCATAGAARRRWRSPAPPRRRWTGSAPSARSRRSTPGGGAAGYLQVSTAPAHDAHLERALDACRELGEAEAVAGARAPSRSRARCASPAFRGGAVCPELGHRAAGAAGLRDLRGGCSRTGSRSTRTRRCASSRRRPAASRPAPRAARCAPTRAVLAIGGAAKGRRGPLRGRLTVASSHVVLTEPVPDAARGDRLDRRRVRSPTAAPWSTTSAPPPTAASPSAGAAAGSRSGARIHGRAEVDPEVIEASADPPLRVLPRRSAAAASPTPGAARSTPRRPTCRCVATLRGGRAFVAAGYTGNGVGPSNMVGRTLASLALDRHDEPRASPSSTPLAPRVPPEPFHWIGGEAIRLGILAKEEAEMAGRAPGKLASRRGPGPRADRLPHRPLSPHHVCQPVVDKR